MSSRALASTLRSRRFWLWQIGGALIYSVPATIRLATGNIHLPILSAFMPPWRTPFVPGNIVEKVLVNAFFPGGAGAVAGEVFHTKHTSHQLSRKQKYLARLGGALIETSVWSLIQFVGYVQNINGSYGGNLFESPYVFPLNFTFAALAIFTPDVIGFLRNKLKTAYHRPSGEKS
ncbi:MAG: hypothetical protein ACM3UL_02125 [Ignavibacteria bacterium]